MELKELEMKLLGIKASLRYIESAIQILHDQILRLDELFVDFQENLHETKIVDSHEEFMKELQKIMSNLK